MNLVSLALINFLNLCVNTHVVEWSTVFRLHKLVQVSQSYFVLFINSLGNSLSDHFAQGLLLCPDLMTQLHL